MTPVFEGCFNSLLPQEIIVAAIDELVTELETRYEICVPNLSRQRVVIRQLGRILIMRPRAVGTPFSHTPTAKSIDLCYAVARCKNLCGQTSFQKRVVQAHFDACTYPFQC